MKAKGIGLSHPGLKRTDNEDSWLIDETKSAYSLYVVCDGVGGHAGGEIASRTAADEVKDFFSKNSTVLPKLNASEITALIERAVQMASAKVYALAEKDPTKKGMGTTLVLLLVVGAKAFVGHVGDSRVYLVRNGKQHLLTEDHSVVADQLKRGMIKKEDASRSMFAHVITRAVGLQEWVEVDTLALDTIPGDQFLLCSDGLCDYFSGEEFLQYTKTARFEQLAARLIDFANSRGGGDNTTALTVQIEGETKTDQGLTTDEKLAVLKKIPLFQYLSYQELVRILNICKMKSFSSSEKIIQEGSTGSDFFIILSGSVKVTKGATHLATLKNTDFFGEMQLLDKVPRSATVTSESAVKVLVIERNEFYSLLKRDQPLAVKIFWEFCQVLNGRLRAANELFVGKMHLDDADTGELPFTAGHDLVL
jgi:serine/threonine protein phosphatase PrpC